MRGLRPDFFYYRHHHSAACHRQPEENRYILSSQSAEKLFCLNIKKNNFYFYDGKTSILLYNVMKDSVSMNEIQEKMKTLTYRSSLNDINRCKSEIAELIQTLVFDEEKELRGTILLHSFMEDLHAYHPHESPVSARILLFHKFAEFKLYHS